MASDAYLRISGIKGKSADSAPPGLDRSYLDSVGSTAGVEIFGGELEVCTWPATLPQLGSVNQSDRVKELLMLEAQPKDSRGLFMIPQAPEDAGYYVYGTPGGGAGQYAHPAMMTAILRVEREWQTIDNRKFGVGNISLAGGVQYGGHSTHRSGLEVDVRPLRKDGRQIPVYWSQNGYDRAATAKLIELFRTYASVVLVYFNDNHIPLVTHLADHDHHFHVKLRF